VAEATALPDITEDQARKLQAIVQAKGRAGLGDNFDRSVATLRKFAQANPEIAKTPAPAPVQRILTDPVPTGIREIDQAGEEVPSTFQGASPFPRTERIPSLDEFPFDHPLRIKADQAAQGVDYRRGLPLWQRIQVATSSNAPSLRAAAIQRALGENFAQVPDDLPKFRYDTGTGAFQVLQPDLDQPGKFRWTSMDGSGLEIGDLGDMLNLAEIGSLAGSLVGTGKSKVFTFAKESPNLAAATGGLGGGIAGRVVGEGASIIMQYLATGGEEAPTVADLVELGWDGAKIELFAAATGELGAKILRTASNTVQDLRAAQQGKRTVTNMEGEEISKANERIQETQRDLARVRDVLGREDLPVTEGTATHSIDLIEAENFALKNAAKADQRAFNRADARGKRTTQDYINAVFGGNEKYMGDHFGTIARANDALNTGGTVTVAQNAEGLVGISLKASPQNGVKVKPEEEFWQIRGSLLPQELRGLGLGKDMYRVAQQEAAAHGKVLASDAQVSESALNVWKSLDGDEAFGRLQWNDDISFNKASRKWESNDGVSPVVRMVTPEPVTPKLIATGEEVGRGASGRMEARKEFKRFLRSPGRRELGQVLEETRGNPFIAQDLKEAVLRDYEAAVAVKGKFSAAAFEQWKDETGRVLDEVFSPEEMLKVRVPGGLRSVVDASAVETASRRNGLSTIMGVPTTSPVFKDRKTMWASMKGLESKQRRRAMGVLDSMGAGDSLRGLFREELRNDLLTKTKGANSEGYFKWLNANKGLIGDMLQDSTYINHLNTVGNILKRRSDRAMVVGTGVDVNPTALGLTRVIFGPLSRAQRFISASRRGQVRAKAAKSKDIITDPAKLQELVQLRVLPVESRQVARFIQDNGLAEPLGWFDDEAFDANNPQHRQRVAGLVQSQLQEELHETVE
jgi:hypothetical protein